jgi:ADP-ribosylglycohydrolase
MRAPIIGALLADDPGTRASHVRAATRITHTDPRAERAAQAIADLMALAITRRQGELPPRDVVVGALAQAKDACAEWRGLLEKFDGSAARRMSTAEFAESIGQGSGVSGYAYSSALVAAYAWRRAGADFTAAIRSVLLCGGDTDSVGALTGALCGASMGLDGIPKPLRDAWRDWPITIEALEAQAQALASGKEPASLTLLSFPRNLLFLAWAITILLRRLFPPY